MSESTSILVIKDTILIFEIGQNLSVPNSVYLKDDANGTICTVKFESDQFFGDLSAACL